jgi:hypothetical protein
MTIWLYDYDYDYDVWLYDYTIQLLGIHITMMNENRKYFNFPNSRFVFDHKELNDNTFYAWIIKEKNIFKFSHGNFNGLSEKNVCVCVCLSVCVGVCVLRERWYWKVESLD